MLRRAKQEQAAPARTGPPRVLVVNEEPDACELLCRVLAAAGYEVARAHDQGEATEQIADAPPDCVLLDLGAGGIGTNLKLLDALRTHLDPTVASIRVVLASTQPNNRMFSWQSGVDAFLVRPFHVEELLSEMRAVLERHDDERARHRRSQLGDALTPDRADSRPWEHRRFAAQPDNSNEPDAR